jgi:hypothetical protein
MAAGLATGHTGESSHRADRQHPIDLAFFAVPALCLLYPTELGSTTLGRAVLFWYVGFLGLAIDSAVRVLRVRHP